LVWNSPPVVHPRDPVYRYFDPFYRYQCTVTNTGNSGVFFNVQGGGNT